MKTLSKVTLLLGALALSACTNGLFNGAGGAGAGGGTANPANNVNTTALDPSSPAYFSQTIGDRVLFAVDQSTLTDQGRATLARQASWLQTNGTYSAIIEGHADEQGTRIYNLNLGSKRATAARDYLISQGIAGSRLQIVTYGKERPIEVCSDEACYAKNRRAVTVISAGVGS